MERDDDDSESTRRTDDDSAKSSAARAEAAISAIAAGADPGAEAQNLSNQFTDDLTARLRRLLHGPRRGQPPHERG